MSLLLGQSHYYRSYFISYSSPDREFVKQLHDDLQKKDMRCWYAPEGVTIGEERRISLNETIRRFDKLLLILSEHSVNSQWIREEVKAALRRELELKQMTDRVQQVLFPIQLDDALMEANTGWSNLIKKSHNVFDFSNWEIDSSYRKGVEELVGALAASLLSIDK